MKGDSLGDRMKGYEKVTKTKLMKRTPVIIRIDGKAFHTWTKGLKHIDPGLANDPFSDLMNKAMSETTRLLVENIQNAVFGYTQSDEISILLNDWKQLNTSQWFDNSIQKMASVSASMATAYFNSQFKRIASPYAARGGENDFEFVPAFFDARVFNIPKEEVVNYFVWRQQDASRNSVQMLGRHYFSHKQMDRKNVSQVQDMLMNEKGVNWNNIETWKRRGTCVERIDSKIMTMIGIDREIPIFTQDRGYIEKFLEANKDE